MKLTRATIVFVLLLLFGALLWSKGRDPFERIWFKVNAGEFGKVQCIAVLPKMSAQPLSAVIYLHGSGGSLQRSGNELRQLAEMGLAAVGMEYNQTNHPACEAQFIALLEYLQRQQWAHTNAMAWIGYSLGAEKVTRIALQRPKLRPNTLVRLGGGWNPDFESVDNSGLQNTFETNRSRLNVLILHGSDDNIFPVSQAEQTADFFRTAGASVERRILQNVGHGLDPNRDLLFRTIGEYCVTHLKGASAFGEHRSIAAWQAGATPLWVFWLPAFSWVVICSVLRLRAKSSSTGNSVSARPRRVWEIGLRWLAALIATVAIAQSVFHLVTPRLVVGKRTLAIARNHLIQSTEKADFDFLAAKPVWDKQILEVLLTHVELANYNRQLVNWQIPDPIYRDFVLSPLIAPELDTELNWRRKLWESFYPRIRKESSLEAAAEVVVRHLRERVTIVEGDEHAAGIENIWLRQIANPRGFEGIYVAALRSTGIPARLATNGRAEFWNGSDWKFAPGPLIATW